ncbi:MAG: NAD(P)/FAD-dependent oxidoreductase [Candidatus Hydrogenedentes bacterium]|nr:NAD(P)/FAD-dependent oxidoreductase [Candidatus Hydrogenedentota bacterium]
MASEHRVVIIGGGFAGLHAARKLRWADVQVTLLDKRNFHLFQPLLYQVATGALSPGNIAAPLRGVLKHQENTRVLLADVQGIDPVKHEVLFAEGGIPYDSLIIAAGAGHTYFGNDEWAKVAPGLKTIEDATEIRRRILLAFENAERETAPEVIQSLLTFVIVGAGPTGVELAGALKEISTHTLQDNFRKIRPRDARVILIEHANRVLPPFSPELSAAAEAALKHLGTTVMTGTKVTQIAPDHVRIERDGREETIATRTVLWAAGARACPLAAAVAEATGAQVDRGGRIIVEPDLTIPGYPEIFVIGDMAHFAHQTGASLPGVAQVAIQQGRYAAKLISRRLRSQSMKPFHYRDLGSLATIGRAQAVAQFGRVKMSGLLAWMTWLFVHLMHIVQFQNRVLVFFQWSWCYLTWNRSARLITGDAGSRRESAPAPGATNPRRNMSGTG